MKRMIFVLLMFVGISVSAQNNISGKVFDATTKAPLQGASISITGKTGTTTDKEGSFTIACKENAVISISYIGYETYSHKITKCGEALSVSLVPVGRNLDAVEITATSNANKGLLYQPAAITKLSTTEIKRSTGLFMDDAINGNVPGVSMNRRTVAAGQQFNIRGYGNGTRGTRGVSSNFDGQGYKVYLNGIPVTDAEGITTMDDIDFGSIGNVEALKGPAGTLYGLAIAGAVNLNTIKPEKGKTSIGQDILIGNYGLRRFTTHFQTSGVNSSLLVNYGNQHSDGFTIHNKSDKNFVNVAGDFQPNSKQSVTAYFGYSNSYDQRSGELTLSQWESGDYTGNIEYIKRNGHSNVYTVRAGLGHTYVFNSAISNTTTVFGTAFNSNVSSAGGWTDKASTNLGVRSTFDTKFSLGKNISLSGITGVEAQRQNATTIAYGMVKNPLDTNSVWTYGNPYYWIIGNATSNVYTTTATTSVFTEWTLGLPKDFSITAGVGYSNMKIALDDRFYVANKPTHYDTTYGKMFSPHVAINKVFNKKITAYIAYSSGYKAPVSSYFFIPFSSAFASQTGIVNRNLKPERGDQFEIGSKGNLLHNKLNYQLALFNAVFKDKMTTVAVPFNASTTLLSYVTNGGKQDHKGVEFSVRYTALESSKGFIKSLTPFANFTYSDFKYKNYQYHIIAPGNKDSVVDYSGHAVAAVSKFVGNLGVDLVTKPGLYANITYFYKDKMPITSDGINWATSYSLLNTKLGFQHSITRHFDVDVFFGVNNIANTKYPIMVFANQLPDAYIAAPPKANYFGGLNVKYNF